jgi:hypothetical protein
LLNHKEDFPFQFISSKDQVSFSSIIDPNKKNTYKLYQKNRNLNIIIRFFIYTQIKNRVFAIISQKHLLKEFEF